MFMLASLAAAGAGGYPGLMLAAALAGCGNAPFHPVDFTILNQRVSPPRLGYAFSAHGLTGNLGWALAPAFLVGIGALSSWRLAYGCAALMYGAVMLLLFAQRDKLRTDIVVRQADAKAGDDFAFMKLPVVWWCFGFFFLSTMTIAVVQSFSASILKALHGISFEAATATVTAYMLCGAVGVFVGGFVAARQAAHSDRVVAMAMSGGAVLLALCATGWLSGLGTVAVLAATGFAVGVGGPSRDLMIKKATPQGRHRPRLRHGVFGAGCGFLRSRPSCLACSWTGAGTPPRCSAPPWCCCSAWARHWAWGGAPRTPENLTRKRLGPLALARQVALAPRLYTPVTSVMASAQCGRAAQRHNAGHDATMAGHLLVECLVAQGVTHAFGVPGESYLAVLDGFHAHADKIQFIINRQEGGAAFMAEAHGKLTGRPGVCFVTRGPGATNASIGVHTAFQDSTPLVLFVGDVASDTRDREPFQEVDYNAFFGPSTKGMAKRVERIDDARRIPEYVARAFATAMNGRPGPVVLVLPEDMLTHTVDRATTPAPQPRQCPVTAWTDPQALATLQGPAAGGTAPHRHCRRQRLDGGVGAGAAVVRRELATAGGQCVPLPGHLRQPPPELRRRCGHRHQPQAGATRQGRRPGDRPGPAPGRDDHQRLHAAAGARARSRSWCTSTATRWS